MAISDIIQRGAAYCICDSNGKKSAAVPVQAGELLGICHDFIILRQGGLYLTCGEDGKKIGTVPRLRGRFQECRR